MSQKNNFVTASQLVLMLALGLTLFIGVSAKADLKSDMQQIGTIFKALGKQYQDPSQDADSAKLAGQLIPLFTDALSLVPSSVTSLPADQQGAALANYKQLMQHEIDDATALQQAFASNDAGKITTVIQDMAATRKSGHDQFNPQ